MLAALSQFTYPLLAPLTWLFVLQLAALWLLHARKTRAAAVVVSVSAAAIAAIAFTPLAEALIRPLEQQIQRPAALPEKVDGIIALAGAENARLTHEYGRPQLNSEAERITELIVLARQYPRAKIVFSGSSPAASQPINESEVVRRFVSGLGFERDVVYEQESRNTGESAVMTHRLLAPAPGETWVLITSASHMPRAYGAFKKAGWDIVPYAVSYRASAQAHWRFGFGEGKYDVLIAAIHEWVGLAVYRMTGRL